MVPILTPYRNIHALPPVHSLIIGIPLQLRVKSNTSSRNNGANGLVASVH